MSKDPFFFLNHINTFEDANNNLVVDVIGYDGPGILDEMYLDKLRSGSVSIKDEGKILRLHKKIKEKYRFLNALSPSHASASSILVLSALFTILFRVKK